jgi:hypothetical protein
MVALEFASEDNNTPSGGIDLERINTKLKGLEQMLDIEF